MVGFAGSIGHFGYQRQGLLDGGVAEFSVVMCDFAGRRRFKRFTLLTRSNRTVLEDLHLFTD